MGTILELKSVTKKIKNKTLVEDISFSINEGEVFGFLGPNGSGKTTTIKMITGLFKTTSGDIFVLGQSINSNLENALSNIGAIIENPELYGYLTGRENLEIFSNMYTDISSERLDEVIQLVKLANRIDEKVKTYSLGMRQRLGIAQAIMHKPKLLILDEPTNGLDPVGIKELREMLQDLAHKEKIAVMVSSHILSEMQLLCDRFGIIDEGKLVALKSPKDFQTNQENSHYALETNNNDKAIEILKDKFDDLVFCIGNSKLDTRCTRERIADINSVLVNSGFKVYAINLLENSLEDTFIEMTSGSKKQIR